MTTATRDRNDPYSPYRQQMLTPARVKELSQLRPARVVFDVALCWAFIVGAWSLVAWRFTWWTVAIAMVVIGTRYYALFIIGHDGLHRRLFPDRKTNDLFCDLFVLGPIGAITRLNNRNHLGHHQHLSSELDPDRHKHGCFNKTDLTELLGYLSGITSIWRSVHNVFFASGRAPTGESRDDGYVPRDFIALAVVQGALIGGLTWWFGWWGWPLLWAAPVYVFTYLGDSIRSFAEHSHPQADALADEHRLITYVSSLPELMFFAPMNMNYHAAHHLWVSIPYYNLPVADAEMRRHPLAAELEWRRSYVGYIVRYAFALPLEECRVEAVRRV
ncbi:MAG TPA: fatty acid desaturase [Gemmatimonadaceae bacterium]|nr:fatty acid desaturase [Gemmatimonadaceae bacterium]